MSVIVSASALSGGEMSECFVVVVAVGAELPIVEAELGAGIHHHLLHDHHGGSCCCPDIGSIACPFWCSLARTCLSKSYAQFYVSIKF